MFRFIGLCFGTLVRLLRARRGLLLENLGLRQQLAVLKRRHPWPRLDLLDKFFWVAISRFWSGWQQSLIAVTPETVVRWHRGGFRLYWKLISKVSRFDWMGFQCDANLNVHLTVSSAQVEITAGLVAWPIHRPWVLP
jgi:hypothetical protein